MEGGPRVALELPALVFFFLFLLRPPLPPAVTFLRFRWFLVPFHNSGLGALINLVLKPNPRARQTNKQ
jgi:uncharacterized membrane protein YdfJ with MMPL/SSD domain